MTQGGLTKNQRIGIHFAGLFLGLLVIIWAPIRFLYRGAVCLLAWFLWVSPKRNVIVAYNAQSELEGSISTLMPVLGGRAVFLDYSDRKRWRFSIPTQLFRCFGPEPLTEFFMPGFLPAVIVIRRFRKPVNFSFGQRTADRHSSLARLQAELGKN